MKQMTNQERVDKVNKHLEELESDLRSNTYGIDPFSEVQKRLEQFSISNSETPILDLKTNLYL